MARRFAKVSEEKIKTVFFYPSDLVNTKTTIPLRVSEEQWIYTSTGDSCIILQANIMITCSVFGSSSKLFSFILGSLMFIFFIVWTLFTPVSHEST